jgi:hypothetical protein
MSKTIRIPDPFSPFSNGGRPTTAGDSPKHVMNASMTPRSIQGTAPVRNKPALTPNTPSEKAKSVTPAAKTRAGSNAVKTSPVKDLTVVSTPSDKNWSKTPLTPDGSYLRRDGVLIKGDSPSKQPFGQEEWYPDLTNAYKLKSSSYG